MGARSLEGAPVSDRQQRYGEKSAYRKQHERQLRWIAALILLTLAAIAIGIELGRAAFIYGDWRCAFADCRITVVSPAQ